MVDQWPRLNVDASHEGGDVVLEVPVEAVEVGERCDGGAFYGGVADEATHFADVGGGGYSVGGEGGAVVVPVCLERGGGITEGEWEGKGRGGRVFGVRRRRSQKKKKKKKQSVAKKNKRVCSLSNCQRTHSLRLQFFMIPINDPRARHRLPSHSHSQVSSAVVHVSGRP